MSINRRNFFKNAGLGITAFTIAPGTHLGAMTTKSVSSPTENKDGQQLFIGENIAVAETSFGKVKGFILDEIYNYRGIPYGADTSGTNRFMPPQRPEKWTNVRPAVFFGNSAPQDIYDRSAESYSAFVDHWNYDVLSEDCLRLNIWTPGLKDAKKRPVLVWLHGGGFSRGNGIEQDGYNGQNISKYGDIVFCSINHRLGALGFSDLSKVGGEKLKDSGNAGLLDIVAALEWIQENIDNFGGDPSNVTVMGQSGGGAKVCTIVTMAKAKGLVHRGVSLSGSSTKAIDQSYSQKLGEYILKEAGLESDQVAQLQQMPWVKYLQLAQHASAKFDKQNPGSVMRRGGFGPVADGISLPTDSFFESNNNSLPDVPMLFCTTFHEWNPDRDDPSFENVTLLEVVEKIRKTYGENSGKIVETYARLFPDCRPIEIWALIASNRKEVVEAANTKLQQKSPVYMAWFGWGSPLFDGRHRAFHCLDISFWFLNTDLMVTHTGGGARPRKLSVKMADALLGFMRKGNPSCTALSQWPVYKKETGEVMVLNDTCNVKYDPDREARVLLG